MDDGRLKKGHVFTDDYFERQLQHIRAYCHAAHVIPTLDSFYLDCLCKKPKYEETHPSISAFSLFLLHNFLWTSKP
jgi:hypothetical protein